MAVQSHTALETVFPIDEASLSILTDRAYLVESLVDLIQQKVNVLIRAPPQTGKTTLLALLGRRILQSHPDLEPIAIRWPSDRDGPERLGNLCHKILGQCYEEQKVRNQEARDLLHTGDEIFATSSPRRVYLIDDAQNTYQEVKMWDHYFKNQSGLDYERRGPCFLLMCSYGDSDGVNQWGPGHWEAATMTANARVELYPVASHGLQILLNNDEIQEMIERWAITFNPPAVCHSSVRDFIKEETQGHVGCIGLLLRWIKDKTGTQFDGDDSLQSYFDAEKFRELAGRPFLISLLETGAVKGFWTDETESEIRQILSPESELKYSQKKYCTDITFEEVCCQMREAVRAPKGLEVSHALHYLREDPSKVNRVLGFCHQQGLLHSHSKGEKELYTFPSSIHRRVALMRLEPPPIDSEDF